MCPCSVYESIGEVLKFTTAAAHKINVGGESDGVMYGHATNLDGCVVVMECGNTACNQRPCVKYGR